MTFSIPFLLSAIIFLPLVGAGVVLLISNEQYQKYTALAFTLITFAISLLLLVFWRNGEAGMQFVEQVDWLPAYNLSYHLGVDGISLFLVLLTTFLMPIVIYFSNLYVKETVGPYLALMLVLQTAMTGVFLALDMVLFFLFFEVSLIPMYFLIGLWGGANRLYATTKFFLYTFAGSAFLFVGILAVYSVTGTADITELTGVQFGANFQMWVFTLFAIGFAVKVPIFPLHTWLPDAHVQAPTAGSIVLAGVLLKMGTYGYVRFALPLFPAAAAELGWIIATLGRHRHPLRGHGCAGAEGRQIAGRLQLRCPPGLCDARHLCAQRTGHQRGRTADGQPRLEHRRTLPDGRSHLRTATHTTTRRLWRSLEERAHLLVDLPGGHHEQRRSAGPERLCRRIHHPARHVRIPAYLHRAWCAWA